MVNCSSVKDGIFDGFKVVIQDNDLTCFFCRFGSASHGKTDVCTFQCRGVVDTVTGHADYQVHLLAQTHHTGFVGRQCSCDHTDLRYDLLHLFIAHLIELCG